MRDGEVVPKRQVVGSEVDGSEEGFGGLVVLLREEVAVGNVLKEEGIGVKVEKLRAFDVGLNGIGKLLLFGVNIRQIDPNIGRFRVFGIFTDLNEAVFRLVEVILQRKENANAIGGVEVGGMAIENGEIVVLRLFQVLLLLSGVFVGPMVGIRMIGRRAVQRSVVEYISKGELRVIVPRGDIVQHVLEFLLRFLPVEFLQVEVSQQ